MQKQNFNNSYNNEENEGDDFNTEEMNSNVPRLTVSQSIHSDYEDENAHYNNNYDENNNQIENDNNHSLEEGTSNIHHRNNSNKEQNQHEHHEENHQTKKILLKNDAENGELDDILPLPPVLKSYLKGEKVTKKQVMKLLLSKKIFVPFLIISLLLFVILMAKPEVHDKLQIYSINKDISLIKKLERKKLTALEVDIAFREIPEDEEGSGEELPPTHIKRKNKIMDSHFSFPLSAFKRFSLKRNIFNNFENLLKDEKVSILPYPVTPAHYFSTKSINNENVTEPTVCFRVESLTSWPEEKVTVEETECTNPSNHAGESNAWLKLLNLYKYSDKTHYIRIIVYSNSEEFIPLKMTITQMDQAAKYQLYIGFAILGGVYTLIVFEIVHRAIASILGAFCGLAALSIIRGRPSLEKIMSWVDPEIILLLFGMMVVVAIFARTGFFEWIAVQAFRISKGRKFLMYTLLCVATAVISAFLDNVTTMLLISPVSIRLCEVLGMDFVPLLLSEVIMSNVGGTATLIGDPPNILIGAQLNLTFLQFILNLAPVIIVCGFFQMLFIRFYFRKEFKGKAVADIVALQKQYTITDKFLLAQALPVLGGIIVMFFLATLTHINAAWIAVIGGMILLMLGTPFHIEGILHKVEWSTLLFFGSLFILMETLKVMGVVAFIADQTSYLITIIPSKLQLAAALVIIIWVSAFTSAFIDNIPYAATMIPVIRTLSRNTGLPLKPLAWALALGACLGGNGTIVGASANVITVGISEGHKRPISFVRFFKVGFPSMLITIAISSIYLLIVYAAIGLGH